MIIENIKNLCFNEQGKIKSPNHSKPVFLKKSKIFEEVMNLTHSLPDNTSIGSRLKYIYMDCPQPNKCLRCLKPTKWLQQEFKYNNFCSRSCANLSKNSNPDFLIKIKKGMESVNRQTANKKRIETTRKKYGVDHILQSSLIHEKIRKTRKDTDRKIRKKTFEKYGLDIDLYENIEYLKTITQNSSSYSDLSNRYYNSMPLMTIFRHYENIGFCPNYEKQTSNGEKEIRTFLEKRAVVYKSNDRTLIKPLEIDIVIPDKHIAIEFNGVYWHTEKNGHDKSYHLQKSLLAKAVGYSLIHIFENNWECNKKGVENYLLSKLGLTEKVGARKTNIIQIDNITSNNFCNENHIQGSTRSSYNLALVYNNQIVAVATFGPSRFISSPNTYELIRFCSKYNTTVVGGLGKLINQFQKNFPNSTLISYCDRSRSDGNSYLQSGWKLHHISSPGYQYTKSGKVFNRQHFQRHKLKNMSHYSPEKTEWQIMQDEGYSRIWDCGQLVFYK